jgi:hypothetical protein
MFLDKRIFIFLIASIPILFSTINGLSTYLSFGILSLLFGFFLLNHLNIRFKILEFFLFIFLFIYIAAGFENPAWLIDIRITLTSLMFFFVFNWSLRSVSNDKIINIIFFLNFGSFVIFIFIYYGIIPNLYFDDTIAAYQDYKFIANPIFLFYIFPFLFALNNRKANKIFLINFLFGFITGILSGSLQTLILVVLIHGLVLLNPKKFRFYNMVILLAGAGCFFYFMNYVDVRFTDKMKYVFEPFESSTVQTRISDFLSIWPIATASIEQVIFGSGIGIRSTVYRFNESYPSLSEYKTFLEIDNGFFYIFHRYGLIGILFFFYGHKKIFCRIKGINSKVIFLIIVIVINSLSIHYWSHFIFPILIALILTINDKINEQNNPL